MTATYQYSGSGDVTAPVQPVDVVVPIGNSQPSTSNSGCEPSDFDDFTAGNVALMQRGTCDFAVKAENAEDAGASAAIIFNEGQPGRTDLLAGTLGGNGLAIPVLGLSYADGAELVESARAQDDDVHAFASTLSEIRPTKNVIADTKKGDKEKTLVVGSHLDSVVEGPGINDNGSGTLDRSRGRRGARRGQDQAAPARAVRVLGRRGVRPAGLRRTTSRA